jgi:hypothetical protein
MVAPPEPRTLQGKPPSRCRALRETRTGRPSYLAIRVTVRRRKDDKEAAE